MNQTVLITGASTGIGRELAMLFAKDNYRLVLIAREKGRLEDLAEELKQAHRTEVTILAKDLSLFQSVEEVCLTLEQNGIHIDILVNNAGFGVFGPFLTTDWDKEAQMIQLNILTLTHLTKRLLPAMVQKRSGRIMFVASTGSFQPGGPFLSVYYATKAYILSFSEAITHELKGTGVSVTTLCPGPTSTEFEKRAGFRQSKVFEKVLMDAKVVAEIGYKGLRSGKSLVIPGIQNKVSILGVRFLPRKVTTQLIGNLQRKRMGK
jgi:uncharacterized protein